MIGTSEFDQGGEAIHLPAARAAARSSPRPASPRPTSRRLARFAPAAVIAALLAAAAQPRPASAQSPSETEDASATNLPEPLLGDMGGLRSVLGRYGVSIGLQTLGEVFGNVSGGIQRNSSLNGQTMLSVGVDTEKAFGWTGGIINASGFWIYGPNFSNRTLANLQTVSGVAAEPSVRLWELWFQQATPDGRFDVKVGLQSVDQEFMTSTGSSLFLNTMMGWPMLPSADMYAGGPAYPLSSLGIRLRAQPGGPLSAIAGVFQDNPPGGPFDNDGQLRGATRYGANFNLRTGALFMAELRYAIGQPPDGGDPDAKPAPDSRPGIYKLGAWFDTASFPDQRFDTDGLSLADPASNGMPRMHRHNFSVYGVMDQTIIPANADGLRAVGVFLRPMFAPRNQNLIDFSINGGVTLKAPFKGRDNDTFGVGFGVANVSRRTAGLDRDTASFSGLYTPVRGTETFLEITYQAQVTPWWQVQPDFQYFWNPGGGIASPRDPGRRIGNEAVFGLRTVLVL